MLTFKIIYCYNGIFDLTNKQAYVMISIVRWSVVKTLIEIKQGLEGQVGKRLKLTANGGRRRTVIRSGVLSETYPAVFVVELDQEENAFERVSYSYADVLTDAVEISFLEEKSRLAVE